jgi:hypothetical protein
MKDIIQEENYNNQVISLGWYEPEVAESLLLVGYEAAWSTDRGFPNL